MTRLHTTLSPAAAGACLMITAGALFAVINTLLQFGVMVQGIAPTKLAFWQYLIASVFSVPWLLSRVGRAMRSGNFIWHLLRVGLAAGGIQLWTMGLAFVPIWQAIALVMLSPFFVTFGAGLFLKEVTTVQRWVAVSVGFLGGMIILAPWSDSFSLYAFLPIGAAALWAFSSLLTKHLTRTETPETLTVYLLLLLTPINAAIAWGDGMAISFDVSWSMLVGVGLLTALAQYSLAKAYSVADAAYLQPFDHIKLPFNVLLGVAVFGFVPPGSMWLGALLIVSASFYLLREEFNASSVN